MNEFLKTKKCIACGKEATAWGGLVIAYRKMALGNPLPVEVRAGWCDDHKQFTITGEVDDIPGSVQNISVLNGKTYLGRMRADWGLCDVDLFGRPVAPEVLYAEGDGCNPVGMEIVMPEDEV